MAVLLWAALTTLRNAALPSIKSGPMPMPLPCCLRACLPACLPARPPMQLQLQPKAQTQQPQLEYIKET